MALSYDLKVFQDVYQLLIKVLVFTNDLLWDRILSGILVSKAASVL